MQRRLVRSSSDTVDGAPARERRRRRVRGFGGTASHPLLVGSLLAWCDDTLSELRAEPVGVASVVWVPGLPVSKGRGRASRGKGKRKVVVRTPAKTRRYEQLVAQSAQVQGMPRGPRGVGELGPDDFCVVRLVLLYPRTAREGAAIRRGRLVKVAGSSDVDNIGKAIVDGLQGARVIPSDTRVAELSVSRRLLPVGDTRPGVLVAVAWGQPTDAIHPHGAGAAGEE